LLVTAAAFLLARNLVRGKYGRAFTVVRENEAVAASMGVSPYRTKVLAFTVASIFGGASGFLYMAAVQYTSPETLSFGHSIALLAAMVIGGAGSIAGSLIGGAYYVFVPQLTNAIDPSFTTLSQGDWSASHECSAGLPAGAVPAPRNQGIPHQPLLRLFR
jgi:branched-chain amino acid transport system permease protein